MLTSNSWNFSRQPIKCTRSSFDVALWVADTRLRPYWLLLSAVGATQATASNFVNDQLYPDYFCAGPVNVQLTAREFFLKTAFLI